MKSFLSVSWHHLEVSRNVLQVAVIFSVTSHRKFNFFKVSSCSLVESCYFCPNPECFTDFKQIKGYMMARVTHQERYCWFVVKEEKKFYVKLKESSLLFYQVYSFD